MSDPTSPPIASVVPPVAETAAATVGERRRRGGSFVWLIVLALAALVFVAELPNERIAWQFAAAVEAREAGDKEQAHELLNEVLEKSPETLRYRAEHYQWKKEDGDYQAALEALEKDIRGEPSNWELYERHQLLLHLGRFEAAIKDCEALVRRSNLTGSPPREMVLNGIAYARAVGNLDLDKALAEVEPAVAADRVDFQQEAQRLQRLKKRKKATLDALANLEEKRMSLASVLDTRGYIHWRRGEFVEAQEDLDEAIRLAEQVTDFWKRNERKLATQMRLYSQFLEELKNREQQLAVLYYHRSLNLKELGRESDAVRDWEKARKLAGREPDETLF